MLPLRHKEEYFVKYQDIPLAKSMDGLKYGECQLDNIWRWVCFSQVYGHNSGTTHYIEKSKKPLSFKYGLGKAEYLSLANWSFKVRRSLALSYAIRRLDSS
jgi:hypothetical protein